MRFSSIMVTLRALVMLVSLVVVPLWAVIGTTWPAKIIAFFGGQARTAAEVRAESAPQHGGLTEAPAFGAAVAAMPATSPLSPPAVSAGPAQPREQPQGNEPRAAAILPPQPVRQPPAAGVSSDGRTGREPRVVENVQASFEEPAANPNRRAVVLGPSNDPRDEFKVLERRLRELGATYYRLETWGNDGELYRFHCQMAQAENPQSNRLFEATDRDAVQAMARVVHDVEGWRTGRLR